MIEVFDLLDILWSQLIIFDPYYNLNLDVFSNRNLPFVTYFSKLLYN